MTLKKLNILFLSGWYPNRVIPTDGNFVQKHAEAVALRSNVIALHVCHDVNCKEKIEITENLVNGVEVVNVYFKKPKYNVPFFSKLQKKLRQIKAYNCGLQRVYEKYPIIDLVHVNILYPVGIAALKLKKKKKIPYIITEHHTIYISTNKAKPGVLQKIMSKKIARHSSCIAPVTENLKHAMIRYGLKAKYEVVTNVVDTKLFYPDSLKPKHEKIKFLHISSLKDSQKNISGMLRVVEKLSKQRNDFESWFIGDGDIGPHIATAKELGIYNYFAFFDGTKTTEEVANIMRSSDCLVLFSHYENFPCVIPEAMASGIPLVSSSVGGIIEHINSNYGILVNPNDEDALLKALNKIIDDLKINKYNKKELFDYANTHFSYVTVSEKFHEIYYKVLKKDA